MGEPQHLNLSVSIFVNGQLACECTKADLPLFTAAYTTLFPKATIESFSVLQLAKKRKAQKEAEESEQEGEVDES